MAMRFHTVSAGAHVAPASAAVTALVYEQPGAVGGGALANPSQAIAGKQLCCTRKDSKENLRQLLTGCTLPFHFDPVGVLVHRELSGRLCQG